MSEIENGGPAFPRTYNGDGHNGMTLRDYFAARCIPIAFRVFDEGYTPEDLTNEGLAKCAYQLADAMLAARSKA